MLVSYRKSSVHWPRWVPPSRLVSMNSWPWLLSREGTVLKTVWTPAWLDCRVHPVTLSWQRLRRLCRSREARVTLRALIHCRIILGTLFIMTQVWNSSTTALRMVMSMGAWSWKRACSKLTADCRMLPVR